MILSLTLNHIETVFSQAMYTLKLVTRFSPKQTFTDDLRENHSINHDEIITQDYHFQENHEDLYWPLYYSGCLLTEYSLLNRYIYIFCL